MQRPENTNRSPEVPARPEAYRLVTDAHASPIAGSLRKPARGGQDLSVVGRPDGAGGASRGRLVR
jgi:hypothetical protein